MTSNERKQSSGKNALLWYLSDLLTWQVFTLFTLILNQQTKQDVEKVHLDDLDVLYV